MADNKFFNNQKIYVETDYENIIVIDPNKVVNADDTVSERLVNHEELVMYANLEAKIIPRSKLVIGSNYEDTVQNLRVGAIENDEALKVNFLKPKGKEYLDTSWTDELTGKDSLVGGGLNQTKLDVVGVGENRTLSFREQFLNWAKMNEILWVIEILSGFVWFIVPTTVFLIWILLAPTPFYILIVSSGYFKYYMWNRHFKISAWKSRFWDETYDYLILEHFEYSILIINIQIGPAVNEWSVRINLRNPEWCEFSYSNDDSCWVEEQDVNVTLVPSRGQLCVWGSVESRSITLCIKLRARETTRKRKEARIMVECLANDAVQQLNDTQKSCIQSQYKPLATIPAIILIKEQQITRYISPDTTSIVEQR